MKIKKINTASHTAKKCTESWCNARLNTLRPGVLWPPTCVQPATGQFHASRKSFWKRKFSKIGALLPFGKWKFDPVKSTIRTLNQHDLSLPWGNFGSNCVKVLLAEAILELFEYNPGGEQAALWKYWSNSHPERGATTAERHTMGKEKRSVRIRIQRWSFFFLSFFFFLTWFLLSFFFFILLKNWFYSLQLEQTLSLSAELCNGNEKRHYLFLTTCHKIHGKRETFHMYVNWGSVLRVVPSTSEPKHCSLMSALKSRGFICLIVNYLML